MSGWWTGRNNRAVYKPVVRRSVFRLCIKMTDNSRSYAGRLESSRCGDNDASLSLSLARRPVGLHVIRAADINFYFHHVFQYPARASHRAVRLSSAPFVRSLVREISFEWRISPAEFASFLRPRTHFPVACTRCVSVDSRYFLRAR